MESATYRIIESFPDVEYYVRTQPLSKSALDLADEIAEKFHVKISAQTIRNFRKKLPGYKIEHLQGERGRNIESLRFIIEILKEQLEEVDDPVLRLRYVQEIYGCIREIDRTIKDEIDYFRSLNSF